MDHNDFENLVNGLERLTIDTEKRSDTTGTAVLASTAVLARTLFDILLALRDIEMSVRGSK